MDKYMTPAWISIFVLAGLIAWEFGLFIGVAWVCVCLVSHAWYFSW